MKTKLVAILAVLVATQTAAAEETFLPACEGYRTTYEHKRVAHVAGITRVEWRREAVCSWTRNETLAGRACFVLEWRENGAAFETWVSAGEKNVVVLKASHDDLFVLPMDAEKRESRVEIKGTATLTVESKVAEREEEIETPAGKFTCVKVTALVKTPATSVTKTVWYARGVGVVKVEKRMDVGSGAVTATEELVLTKIERAAKTKPETKKEPLALESTRDEPKKTEAKIETKGDEPKKLDLKIQGKGKRPKRIELKLEGSGDEPKKLDLKIEGE